MDINNTPAARTLSVDLTVEQVAAACSHNLTLVGKLITHADAQHHRWAAHERDCLVMAYFDEAAHAAEQAQTWLLLRAKFLAAQSFLLVQTRIAS